MPPPPRYPGRGTTCLCIILLLMIALFAVPAAGQEPARPTAWVPTTPAPPAPVPFDPGTPSSSEDHPRDATLWPTVRATPRPPTPTPEPPPPPGSPETTETQVALSFTYVSLPTTPPLELPRTTAVPIPPIVTETYRKAGSTTPIAFFAALVSVFLTLYRRR